MMRILLLLALLRSFTSLVIVTTLESTRFGLYVVTVIYLIKCFHCNNGQLPIALIGRWI